MCRRSFLLRLIPAHGGAAGIEFGMDTKPESGHIYGQHCNTVQLFNSVTNLSIRVTNLIKDSRFNPPRNKNQKKIEDVQRCMEDVDVDHPNLFI
jgi:hypothetical protein